MYKIAGLLNQLAQRSAGHSDLVVAIFIIIVIFILIIPLPTWLLDILIGINMGVSALMLMVALYIPSPLAFSTFPSLLLVTTLFRLGISVASTRLILLQADAGHIIQTFGEFVVGGNIVVGLVIFLILTIVQFIVITKGSERVAEVAARFTLDAMPGKQMSIDSDMRAGLITLEVARERRENLARESQMYGAMDGAMKFVKGDAIAGIIIVVINLLGGMAIGIFQENMPGVEAARTYSILSVGDGLIAQIPALFASLTAGILITRVPGETGSKTNLGADLVAQMIGQPQAAMIAAGVLLIFGLIPGMPGLVFALLALIIGTVGALGLINLRAKENDGNSNIHTNKIAAMDADGQTTTQVRESLPPESSLPVPFCIEVSADLEPILRETKFEEQLQLVRKDLALTMGIPFPGILLRINWTLAPEKYLILAQEVPVGEGSLRPGHILALTTPEHLAALDIRAEKGVAFLPNIDSLWVNVSDVEKVKLHDISVLDSAMILARHLMVTLKRHASNFVGVQETHFLLKRLENAFPELLKELFKTMPVTRVAEVLQRLVEEGISIRNLRTIAETLTDWGQKERDPVLLCEHVRVSLRRQVAHQVSSGTNLLPAHLISPEVEETIRESIRQTSVGSYLALDPDVSQALINTIKSEIGDLRGLVQIPVLLCSMDVRRHVRKLIESDLFEVPVLSYQEIEADVNLQPLSRITLSVASG